MHCIFCAKEGKQTREHVIPQWLASYLGDDVGLDTSLWKRSGNSVERGRTLSRRQTDLVLRRVCTECNSGWMSRLESEARPMLIPLIAGDTIQLNPQTRRVLLRWAVKTAAVLGPLQKAPEAVGKDIRRTLASGQNLGAEVALWAVPTDDRDISVPHWRVGCDLGDHETPILNITGISLGKIAFEVICLNRPDLMPAERIPPMTPLDFQYIAPSSDMGSCPAPDATAAGARFSERATQIVRRMVEEGLVEADPSGG